MECLNCGKGYLRTDGSDYCPGCGALLVEPATSPSSATTQPPDAHNRHAMQQVEKRTLSGRMGVSEIEPVCMFGLILSAGAWATGAFAVIIFFFHSAPLLITAAFGSSSIVLAILAIIFSGIGRSRLKGQPSHPGKNQAKAGIILGVSYLVFVIVGFVVAGLVIASIIQSM